MVPELQKPSKSAKLGGGLWDRTLAQSDLCLHNTSAEPLGIHPKAFKPYHFIRKTTHFTGTPGSTLLPKHLHPTMK